MSSTNQQLTSTTAPGMVFESRSALAEHYKSDWHKYNLKRREAGLPLLGNDDFQARLEAALALRKERQGREERTGTDHLKKKQKGKKNKKKQSDATGVVSRKSQAEAYDRIKEGQTSRNEQPDEAQVTDEPEAEELMTPMEVSETSPSEEHKEESPVIDPRQCLFDKHMSASVGANLERMQRKYGFFVPDQEYLVDKEGLVGYCHEKIKLGHYCLYCQRMFKTWQGCQKHMISTRHTKLRYERGIDLDEFDPFFDFSEADTEFLSTMMTKKADHSDEGVDMDIEHVHEDDDGEWEDVSDDEEMYQSDDEEPSEQEEGDEGNLYAGYEDEIAKFGFEVTPLGELVFPDGRIIGHRGLARYYKQRLTPNHDRAAVIAARQAAGERLYRGRVYNVGPQQDHQRNSGGESSALALARSGVLPGAARGRAGQGVLVSSAGGGFTAMSLYRYKAVVKKARRDDARGQRLQNKTKQNMNRMDKKGNRLMNGVIVPLAPR